MKIGLSFLALALSISSIASAENLCAQSLKGMAEGTRQYITIVKECESLRRQGGRGNPFYLKYAKLARRFEQNTLVWKNICVQTCADRGFCDGELKGACL